MVTSKECYTDQQLLKNWSNIIYYTTTKINRIALFCPHDHFYWYKPIMIDIENKELRNDYHNNIKTKQINTTEAHFEIVLATRSYRLMQSVTVYY